MSGENKTKRLNTLVHLLDVSDEAAYEEVVSQIMAYGPDAIDVLEQAWIKLPDTERQNRLLALIQKLHLERIYQKLTIWANFYSGDILQGYFLVSQYHYSDLDLQELDALMKEIRDDLRYELDDHLTPLQKIKVVNHILFDIHHLRVNVKKENIIESHFLNRLLSTKKGSPIALGLLYMILAQEFGIPLYGLPLTHHFVLAYMDADFPGKVAFNSDVRFYVNPHFKGAAFTAKEITRYLKETKQEVTNDFYYPHSNVALIRRLLSDLKKIHTHFEDHARAEEVAYLLEALGE